MVLTFVTVFLKENPTMESEAKLNLPKKDKM